MATATRAFLFLVSVKRGKISLSLRDYNGQVGEVLAGVKVLNKLTSLGMPERRGSFY